MITGEKQVMVSDGVSTKAPATMPLHLRTARAAALLLLTLLAPAQAQDYTCTTNDGAITITKYIGSGGAVAIPDTIDGLPVTAIGDDAFRNSTSLTSVTIPYSVTNVGNYAFTSCSSLTNVTFGTNVSALGNYAFNSCSSLTNLTFPASLISIGDPGVLRLHRPECDNRRGSQSRL